MAKVFVLIRYHGYEGHSAPSQVFLEEAEARAAQALANSSYDSSWKLYAVPVWPESIGEDFAPELEIVEHDA